MDKGEPMNQRIAMKLFGLLGLLMLLTDKLDSAQVCLDENYRFISGIRHNSAVHYIEAQMIELALKKGNIAQVKSMIARTAPAGHLLYLGTCLRAACGRSRGCCLVYA